ncbi:S26 family signal peptidase [Lacibacterium aquatile]|uniref:S26 family signal peptidase n=1 Tax=Lacibacterium aquatile TaxID=1168082 RepID=A0ABW5DQJ1_9PROT
MRAEAARLAKVLRPALLLVGTCAALAGVANAAGYGFAYQPTDSMPRGLYLLTPAADAPKGALVTLAAPGKPGLTLLKRIAASGGDEVCITGRDIHIAGRPAAVVVADAPPPAILCRVLTEGEVFLLGDGLRSFDSRYFGPIDRSRLIRRAVPL